MSSELAQMCEISLFYEEPKNSVVNNDPDVCSASVCFTVKATYGIDCAAFSDKSCCFPAGFIVHLPPINDINKGNGICIGTTNT